MNINLHISFPGTCQAAFAFYEATFGVKVMMTMLYGQAPEGPPPPPELEGKVLHTAMKLGNVTLMGADAPPHAREHIGGFQVSVDSTDEPELQRIFAALSEGGLVVMPMGPTFWSPLFGMCRDKFGVGWMVGVTGPEL